MFYVTHCQVIPFNWYKKVTFCQAKKQGCHSTKIWLDSHADGMWTFKKIEYNSYCAIVLYYNNRPKIQTILVIFCYCNN